MGTAEEEARTVYGDPDDFAGEMVKMINDKEFRLFIQGFHCISVQCFAMFVSSLCVCVS